MVDDHATNRHILVEMLGSWRMQPTSVASGSEALDELRQAADSDQPYRLVLSDVMMPGMDGLELVEHMRADPALREVTVILLSSAGGADDASRLRELAISRSLIKPVKPSDLLDAITAAFATTAAARPFRPGSGIGNEAVDTDRQLHILLAEDGVINQRVAIGMLERRGHSVVLVDSGRKVLEKLAEEVFDVVLMDVQMPEMDGFEATEVIRRNEKTTGDHQPIVAMTAHAMKGDRDRCLEAGMDGYVPKPVRPKDLYAAIEIYPRHPRRPQLRPEPPVESAPDSSHRPEPPVESAPDSSHRSEPPLQSTADRTEVDLVAAADGVLDWPEAVQRVGGKSDIMKELSDLFLEECPRLMAQIRAALDAGNADDLRREAHTLKGSADLFAAAPTVKAAYHLETIARDQQLDEAEDAWLELKRQVDILLPVLGRIRDEM